MNWLLNLTRRAFFNVGFLAWWSMRHRYEAYISWSPRPVAEKVVRYNVYEKFPGQNHLLGATTLDPDYHVTLVSPGLHTYLVTAINAKGESLFSKPASVTIPKR